MLLFQQILPLTNRGKIAVEYSLLSRDHSKSQGRASHCGLCHLLTLKLVEQEFRMTEVQNVGLLMPIQRSCQYRRQQH